MRVIQFVANKVWGGGERYALDLCRRLMADGIDVRVVTRGSDVVDARFREQNIPVSSAFFAGFTDFRTARIVARVAMNMPSDEPIIIHAHDFKNAIFAIRAKKMLKGKRDIKVVVTRHLIKKAKKDLLNRYIYRNIDAFIFISQLVLDEFFSSNPEIPNEKINLVHNSIYTPPAPTPRVRRQGEPVCLTFTGRLSEEKGLEFLMRSLSRIKDKNWKLRIAGTGKPEYVEALRNEAIQQKISDKIEWLGYQSDIWEVLRKADVGVVPSIWREPFGLTILEFMSQGIPVITTDTGAQREIITSGKDGLLSPPDESKFSDEIGKLVDSEELRQQLGAEALKTFGRFNYETFYRKILKAYQC